jgi:predicted ATPase/class 3 adenylate cyclase
MAVAPHGTVTFLFTDVEGSTRLWEQHPGAMQTALAAHDRIVCSVIERRHGYIFSTAGDAFSAAFWTPQDALSAAVEAQERLWREPWPERVVVRVRMGIHSGTAEERNGDYFGAAVNRAARIMALGHGGQVLVSLATEQLLANGLMEDVALVDLGAHPLTGLSRPERVFQAVAPGLPGSFPPLRSGQIRVGNLPAPLTAFVGRTGERDLLAALVVDHRLVCVTGTGGMGKTRLATVAGEVLRDRFPDGVWFVELAPVSQPDAVDAAAMAALREQPMPGRTAREVVVGALMSRRALVLFDNCEHVLETAAGLAVDILGACPHVHVLATSRQSLAVSGERLFPLGPLAPEDQVQLFSDRASAVRPQAHFERAKVMGLCSRLDGMPLAIELAAARLRSMSLVELAEHLDERFRLLGGLRHDDPRHRTLQAVVDWSFEQLGPAEQSFFSRLSVFAGEFTVGDAEAVAGFDEFQTVDLLDALVDRSLVVRVERDDRSSCRLLETLRQYGRHRLEPDELAESARRHAEHYARVVADCIGVLRAGDDVTGFERLAYCWDNLRQAMQTALAAGDAELALRLVTPLAAYANVRPDPEVATWAAAALALPGAAAHRLALWAHLLLSQAIYPQLDLQAAEWHARQALEIIEVHQLQPLPRPYLALGYALDFQGRFPEALAAFHRAAETAHDQGRLLEEVEAVHNLVTCQIFAGNPWSDDDVRRVLRLAATVNTPRMSAIAQWTSGLAALTEGRAEAAVLLNEAADLAANRLPVIEAVLRGCAVVAAAGGSPMGELAGLVEELKMYETSKVPFAIRGNLRTYTRALSSLERYRAIALIEGAAAATSIFPGDSRYAADHARNVLGPAQYDRLVEDARRMTTDEVAQFIAQELSDIGLMKTEPEADTYA